MKSRLPSKDTWTKLTAAARQDGEKTDLGSAPYGFSTRVVALAFDLPAGCNSLWERLAFRAVSLACLLALVSVAANFSLVTVEAGHSDSEPDDFDPVAVLMAE